MNITIDQALALEAISRLGTFKKAADSLGKGHSAVMYLIKNLETETGLTLLDRSGYRNKLTNEGELILKHCESLINTTEEIASLCSKLKSGWEPKISLVYDGVINFKMITDVLSKVKTSEIPTEIKVSAAYLDEVEETFEKNNDDFMLTVLPQANLKGPSIELKPMKMLLVSSIEHQLAKTRSKLSAEQLAQQVFIRVRGSTKGLGLSTEQMEVSSSILVNDFYSKKQAIVSGLGYGWLPEYLIQHELKSKALKILNTDVSNRHQLPLRLFHRKKELLGRGASTLLEAFEDN